MRKKTPTQRTPDCPRGLRCPFPVRQLPAAQRSGWTRRRGRHAGHAGLARGWRRGPFVRDRPSRRSPDRVGSAFWNFGSLPWCPQFRRGGHPTGRGAFDGPVSAMGSSAGVMLTGQGVRFCCIWQLPRRARPRSSPCETAGRDTGGRMLGDLTLRGRSTAKGSPGVAALDGWHWQPRRRAGPCHRPRRGGLLVLVLEGCLTGLASSAAARAGRRRMASGAGAGSRAQGGGDALGPAGEARAWRADGRIIINQPDWTGRPWVGRDRRGRGFFSLTHCID